MAKIKVNGILYEVDNLSDEAQSQLKMYTLAQAELQRLKVKIDITQAAMNAYGASVAKLVDVKK